MKQGDVEFNLTDAFVDKYKRKKVQWGPLGYFAYKRTYARTLSGNRTEEWWGTVRRVVEAAYLVQKMHCKLQHIPFDNRQAQRSAQTMYDKIFTMKFLPPGRGLANMGSPAMWVKGGACLNNCGFTSTKNIDSDFSGPFAWLMEMSLYGVGVGFDTEGAKADLMLREPRTSREPHVVDDSREGWVDAFRRVLDAYVGRDTLPQIFDYSEIRPSGSPIKTFGGLAPGPGPLAELLDRTRGILDSYCRAEKPVDSTLIVDLANFAGAAVVAGGLRRTAEVALGDGSDEEFALLKNERALKDKGLARWASNNSIKSVIGMDYEPFIEPATTTGEPGFFWLENARAYGRMKDTKNGKDRRVMGCNPCGEQSLEDRELCNLVETFPSRHDSLEEYLETIKYAYLYAKTVTLVKTHDARTNAVMLRNRRIGLSQSGIVEQIRRVGMRTHLSWCDTAYDTIREWDEVYSEWLCVSRSIKVTTVKPSGTVSLLPGVTPGIHFPHSEYYTRRVRVSKQSDLWEKMKEAGYHVEPCVNQPDYTYVVEFPVKEENFDRRKQDVSLWEQLELAAALQYWWSDNQVSITVTVKPEEADDLRHALPLYEGRLKAVSFLPLDPSTTYKQAPYEELSCEAYESRVKGLKNPKLNPTADIDRVEERFCDGDVCLI